MISPITNLFDKYPRDFCNFERWDIEKVASLISEVYATFPKLTNPQREELYEVHKLMMKPASILSTPPTDEQCTQFASALKQWIISSLEKGPAPSVTLRTLENGEPFEWLHIAQDIFKKQTAQDSKLTELFPSKTFTMIYSNNYGCMSMRLF